MNRLRYLPLIPVCCMLLAVLACAQQADPVIYVTATPQPIVPSGEPPLPNPFKPTPTPFGPTPTPLQPTPNPVYLPTVGPLQYKIVAGDTLSAIAVLYGADIGAIIALNPGLNEGSILTPGQTINVPGRPSIATPNLKLIPDSELVYSPGVSQFNISAYIRFQPGFVRVYSEFVGQRNLSAADMIQFFAQSASVNPRLLLALLEYRGGWITNPVPSADAMNYPLGYRNESAKGLFRQLDWAVNQLNDAYYGWKTRAEVALVFPDRMRLAYAPDLNAGTIAVQRFMAQTAPTRDIWQRDVSQIGFLTTYMSLFGDPFRYAVEPLVPAGLQQPPLILPFAQNEVWHVTSGPHGGWDAEGSGWAAIDFAPPKPPDAVLIREGACFVSPNWTTSMSNGLVVRSGDGVVVVDLDLDGDERTGWTIVYLHMADKDRIRAGTIVQPGTQIGHPSCEGFWLRSLGSHVHIARRYNGEWIVADCTACGPGVANIPFVLGGWLVRGYPGQSYQGWLEKDGQVRRAQVGRDDPTNQISW